jgi:hypothetical protein
LKRRRPRPPLPRDLLRRPASTSTHRGAARSADHELRSGAAPPIPPRHPLDPAASSTSHELRRHVWGSSRDGRWPKPRHSIVLWSTRGEDRGTRSHGNPQRGSALSASFRGTGQAHIYREYTAHGFAPTLSPYVQTSKNGWNSSRLNPTPDQTHSNVQKAYYS